MLITIFVISLFIFGWDSATQFYPVNPTAEKPYGDKFPEDTEILGFLRYYMLRTFHNTRLSWILKPTFTCPICMASFWTLVLYPLIVSKINPIEWLVVLVAVSGLNRLIMLQTKMF